MCTGQEIDSKMIPALYRINPLTGLDRLHTLSHPTYRRLSYARCFGKGYALALKDLYHISPPIFKKDDLIDSLKEEEFYSKSQYR